MPLQRIPLGEHGEPIGQFHPRAKHSDALVNELRDLHEYQGLGWRRVAARYPQLPAAWIKQILSYRRRATVAHQWRVTRVAAVVEVQADGP
jgi:hypothetical protein